MNINIHPIVPGLGHPAALRTVPSYSTISFQDLPTYEQNGYLCDPVNLHHSIIPPPKLPQADVLCGSSLQQPYQPPHFVSDAFITDARLPSSSTSQTNSTSLISPQLLARQELSRSASPAQLSLPPRSRTGSPASHSPPRSTPRPPPALLSPRLTVRPPLALLSCVPSSPYNMKAQNPPPYDTDTVADLEQVAKSRLDSRNEIKALKKVVNMYNELCKELYKWFDRHIPLEECSRSDEEGFHFICEKDFHYRTGILDRNGDQAGDANLEDKEDTEGRLEMLEWLKRVDREVRKSLGEAGLEIPGR